MGIEVRPLTPTVGAEICGADLIDLPDGQLEGIKRAFFEHGVVFFRNQPRLEVEQQFDFAGRLGPLHIHPATPRDAKYPGLLRIAVHKDTKVAAGNRWHSDVSCDQEPPYATILQLHQIPPSGGDTLFASMYAAYDALSTRMKTLLHGLTAHHSGEPSYRRLFKFKMENTPPEADHPIVRKHPETGKPALFVNREFTVEINDLPPREGKALLEFLFDHTEQVAFQCRFQWTENAIAMWDNRCVQHHAMWDYWPHERRGHRVTVRGERPLMWDGAI